MVQSVTSRYSFKSNRQLSPWIELISYAYLNSSFIHIPHSRALIPRIPPPSMQQQRRLTSEGSTSKQFGLGAPRSCSTNTANHAYRGNSVDIITWWKCTQKMITSAVVLLKCQLPQRDPCFRVKKKCTECNSSGHLSYCRHQPQYDASLYGKYLQLGCVFNSHLHSIMLNRSSS